MQTAGRRAGTPAAAGLSGRQAGRQASSAIMQNAKSVCTANVDKGEPRKKAGGDTQRRTPISCHCKPGGFNPRNNRKSSRDLYDFRTGLNIRFQFIGIYLTGHLLPFDAARERGTSLFLEQKWRPQPRKRCERAVPVLFMQWDESRPPKKTTDGGLYLRRHLIREGGNESGREERLTRAEARGRKQEEVMYACGV